MTCKWDEMFNKKLGHPNCLFFLKNELNIASSKHSINFSFLVDFLALKHTLTVEKDSSQSCGMAHLAFVPSHLRRENYTSSDSESWWAFIFNSIQFNLFSQVNVIQAFTLPALGKDYLRLKVWPHITKIYNWTFKVRNKEQRKIRFMINSKTRLSNESSEWRRPCSCKEKLL